jgi:molybdopterin-binding protein
MALGIGYGLPFVAQHGTNPYKTQWAAALEGAKGAGATVEDENAGTGSCLVARGQEAYTDGLPATPSLLIVPQFYKAGNLYQDVPPFVAEDSTMRFAVSRNTTATRVNSSGLIESVASGVPRIDWLGQSCPALLVEASATNLALQSEDFTTTWSPTNVTVSANVTGTTDPFGTNLADQIFETAASGLHFLAQTMSITSGTTYTGTIFFKKATGSPDWVQLAFSTTGLAGFANFNLASGTVGNVLAGCTASIENYGNGWYRCRLTQTATASGTSGGPIPVFVNNTNSVTRFLTYTGNTATSIYVFGAQLETGSVATTYIPTTTGTGSRAADVISASGALVSGLIGQTEGTIYAEVDVRNWIASGRILTCSNGTSNERIMIQVGANRTLQAIVTTASADVVDISTASGQVNGVYKCALTYASGDFAFYVNGTQIGTDSSGGVPASTSVFLGKIGTSASTNFLNDRIRAAALYTTRLSNAQLAELTRL